MPIRLDLTGQRFGMLVPREVIARGRATVWRCECDCGGSRDVTASDLLKTRFPVTHCGCQPKPKKAPKFRFNVGARFGRLTVASLTTVEGNRVAYACDCDCGATKTVRESQLVRGSVNSCGCLKRELLGAHSRTHGESNRSSEYLCWCLVRRRCYSATEGAPEWRDYRNRGVAVCSSWRESYDEFLRDMGRKPSPGHSIDRIDPFGNYSCGHCAECLANGWPTNCRWATDLEQARNKRGTRMLEFDGVRKPLAEWCDDHNVAYSVVLHRLNHMGLTDPSVLFAPPRSAKTFDVDGVSRTLAEWAAATGIKEGTLRRRLERGMSLRDALVTPVTRSRRAA